MGEHLLSAIGEMHGRDEAACVAALAAEAATLPGDRAAIRQRAADLVTAVRGTRRHAPGVDQLMHEFSLASEEGVALMCLAEALLRIPDAATAERLIRDKIAHGDWQSHLGAGHSLFVNAASWGLALGGRLLAPPAQGTLGRALGAALARGGEPLLRRALELAMGLLGRHFVMGETIDAALARSAAGAARGYAHSFDMLGEAALSAADAERYRAAYAQAIDAVGNSAQGRGVVAGPGISLKLSALHPRYVATQRPRVLAELLPRLLELLCRARHHDIGVTIDAEECERLELSLELFAAAASHPALAGWQGLGLAVQAYQKRAPALIDWLVALARRCGRRLPLRLVKGAYWDAEIKRAQVEGLAAYPVYTRKSHTDLAYLVCAGRLLAAPDAVYPQFATHNAQTLAAVGEMARALGIEDYEFQCLHGMGETLYDHVVGGGGPGRRCRIYAPAGSHAALLPYLVRRLLENGANSSFVNRLVDPAVDIAELVADPLTQVSGEGGRAHPAIPLPRALFGAARPNSAGIDLTAAAATAELGAALDTFAAARWQAAPLVAGAIGTPGVAQTVHNPARRDDIVGSVTEADAAIAECALERADDAAAAWRARPAAERAACLQCAAELIEAQRAELMSLCQREAGKTWANALGEIREAVDFCRYYAHQARASGDEDGGGTPAVAVCISPWNFPLAIFVGQVAAALAAGCAVIAKPAEQTPLVAARAVGLLHRAGIPHEALQFLPGRGETVGARLVADARVNRILFTGSTEVARQINRAAAGHAGLRLIAETGGQNAMIVDSSALPEQVVRDALLSAFDSAGQRCSALRLLCLQQEIAEPTLALLTDAMDELAVGDPALLATDIGPLIDYAAWQAVNGHVAAMQAAGRRVRRVRLPSACDAGFFVAPTLIEIDSPADLRGEVFGPVLHVLRYRADELPALIEAINATGYGLTLGIHSRIDANVDFIVAQARAGNVYVNRSMIGAVVGVQPFGGEGLSGTGPKAGGPLYLPWLAGRNVFGPAELGVARALPMPEALQRLADWAADTGQQALADYCRDCAAGSLLGLRLALPGPTGEADSLAFLPRGRVFCAAPEQGELLRQLAAVLATGNRALLAATPAAHELLARLPPPLAAEIALGTADDPGAIAAALGSADDAPLSCMLAAREAALVPLFHADGRGHYPLYRLLAERTLSVNTAAAGGNTRLMALAP